MSDFHETVMGRQFYQGTMPRLVKAVENLTEEVKELKKTKESNSPAGKEKAVVFVVDGLIMGAYSTNPEIEIEVVEFDRDLDDRDNLDRLYEKCSDSMTQIRENIVHP